MPRRKSALEQAAPELLEQCKQYERMMVYYTKKDPPIDEEGRRFRAVNLNMLRDIIAQAEGRPYPMHEA